MDKQWLSAPPARKWTGPDAYIEGLIRRRTSRSTRHAPRQRTEPEAPHAMLSTVPFVALLCALAVLTVGIIIAASPWHAAQPVRQRVAEHERGTAEKGWFQEAQKEMHR